MNNRRLVLSNETQAPALRPGRRIVGIVIRKPIIVRLANGAQHDAKFAGLDCMSTNSLCALCEKCPYAAALSVHAHCHNSCDRSKPPVKSESSTSFESHAGSGHAVPVNFALGS